MPLFKPSSSQRSTHAQQVAQDTASRSSSLIPLALRRSLAKPKHTATSPFTIPSNTDRKSAASGSAPVIQPNEEPLPPATPSTFSHVSHQHLDTSSKSEQSEFDGVSHDVAQSVPSGCGISATRRTPARPATPAGSTKGIPQGLLESSLPARLVVSCEGGDQAPPVELDLIWQDVSEWTTFWQKAEMRLAELGEYDPNDTSTRLYLQSGSAYIVCTASECEKKSCFLESQKDWAVQLQRMVASFVVDNPDVGFFVVVRWNFAILSLPLDSQGSLKSAIRTAISKHSDKNWDDKNFIPRKVLESIFSLDNVRNVIDHDDSLVNADFCDSLERWSSSETFAKYVFVNAVSLLAMFVFCKADLHCLYKLLRKCPKDGPIPVVNRPLEENDCPEGADIADFENLCTMQSRFRTHTFRVDPKNRVSTHEQLDANVIVPVLNEHRGQDQKKWLGGGAFGDVFRVKLHSDHHKFHSNRAKVYALKVFRDDRFAGGEDFKAEENALRRLATKPHQHLVIHLAAWTQHHKFYMLFPCARENLRHYLERRAPKSNGRFILNQLRHLRDLSSAVEHIHRLAPGGLGNPAGDKLEPKSGQQRATGLHYDLKPENVLIFTGDDERGDVWKISDFGTARIHDIVVSESRPTQIGYKSHKTKTPTRGDPLYGAPDYAIKGETSRPYDVWSLGCILLEILLWSCHRDYWQHHEFADERLESPPLNGHQSQAYWYEDGYKVGLKPIVVDLIETLKQNCDNWGVLPDLVNMVPDMLRLLPEHRPQAAVVRSNMDSLLFQADVDLEEDPKLYDEPRGRSSKRLAAPPSNSGSRSRGGSIDRHTIDIPSRLREEGQNAQQMTRGHRYTSSGYRADNTGSESDVRDAGQHLTIDTSVPPHHQRSRSPSVTVRSPEGNFRMEHAGTPAVDDSPAPRRTEFSSKDLGY